MYCRKCHKQSPENFVNCAYCGAKLNASQKKIPAAFLKKRETKNKISLKTLVVASLVFAVVLSACAIITASVTGAKPEKTVKAFTQAIEGQNEKQYFALFDNNIKEYKKENRYFGDEETFKNVVAPMWESDDFYTEKCGKNYKLTYSITSSTQLTPAEYEQFCRCLENNFSYITLPSRVELLTVEITAEGEKGEYKSIYNDFWCMKIKGKWYKTDKAVFTEYEKAKLSP